MADTAAQLVDRVLPEAPIRQWVLTLPYPLRYHCAYDSKLTSDVLRAFTRSLFSELRRRARNTWSERAEQCGAVTFIQRFGSALNLNVHFHTLALDGVYRYGLGQDKPPRFLPLPPPSDVKRGFDFPIRRTSLFPTYVPTAFSPKQEPSAATIPLMDTRAMQVITNDCANVRMCETCERS